jgi:hypothetical protein
LLVPSRAPSEARIIFSIRVCDPCDPVLIFVSKPLVFFICSVR